MSRTPSRSAVPAILGLCGLLGVAQPTAASARQPSGQERCRPQAARPDREARRRNRGLHQSHLCDPGAMAPPGVPGDRAAALRGAFSEMVVDPAFIDDVRKANVELSPIDGAAIAALVAKSAATPKDVIRRYNSLVAAPR
jgi:hypothetical protein